MRGFLLSRSTTGMSQIKNIVGPTVRRIRFQKGWTQAVLTARCQRMGWDIGENIIAKIEAQFRCVSDCEIAWLAKALGVKLQEIFPKDPLRVRKK